MYTHCTKAEPVPASWAGVYSASVHHLDFCTTVDTRRLIGEVILVQCPPQKSENQNKTEQWHRNGLSESPQHISRMSSSPTKNSALDSPLRRALEQPPLKRFRVSSHFVFNFVCLTSQHPGRAAVIYKFYLTFSYFLSPTSAQSGRGYNKIIRIIKLILAL